MIRAVDDFLQLGLPRDAQALLLIEIDGCEEELEYQADQIVSICLETGASQVDKATLKHNGRICGGPAAQATALWGELSLPTWYRMSPYPGISCRRC